MKKGIISVLVIVCLAMSIVVFAGCQKDTAPINTGAPAGQLPADHPKTEGGEQPFIAPITEILVPDSVKGKWASVVLTIEDKASGKSNDVTVKIGGEYTIPDTKIKIKVGDFLPDFKMAGSTITSNSADPNNPAVHVTITEGDQELFKSWLYSQFQAIHPFQHEKYGVTLKAGVKS